MTMMGLSLAAAAAGAATSDQPEWQVLGGLRRQTGRALPGHCIQDEYFDVWSPEIATTYGENFWTSMGDHPLPPEIVKRFAGKVIAITGYEQDQVMVDPVGQPGINPERDLSVPINWAYNHHYETWMTGADAQMVEVPAERGDYSNHGAPTRWVAIDRPSAARNAVLRDPDAPTSLWFSEGNGGESRKSFHGYPAGYAQLLNSPTSWRITPMQIDTRRRDCGVGRESIKNCTAFEPWLEPKQARYGRPVSAANWRRPRVPVLLASAATHSSTPTRTKVTEHLYPALVNGTCESGQAIATPATCHVAGTTLGVAPSAILNRTTSDARRPAGCFAERLANGSVAVVYNAHGDPSGCPAGGVRTGEATSLVNVTLRLTLDPSPKGGLATVAVSGPADAWFGVGLDATRMMDSPYAIICNASGAFEQQIGTCGTEGEHCAGDRLHQATLVSNTVVDGVRTVVVTRLFAGASEHHYTFDVGRLSSLNFLTAVGRDQIFAYHRAHHRQADDARAGGQRDLPLRRGCEGLLCATAASTAPPSPRTAGARGTATRRATAATCRSATRRATRSSTRAASAAAGTSASSSTPTRPGPRSSAIT